MACCLLITKKSTHQFILICKKRFIKIVLKQATPHDEASLAEIEEVAIRLRRFLEDTLQNLPKELPWLRNLQYELCVECPYCREGQNICPKHDQVSCPHEDCMCLLNVSQEGQPSFCRHCCRILTFPSLEKWFSTKGAKRKSSWPTAQPSEWKNCADDGVKKGGPTDYELQKLSNNIVQWKALGRQLKLHEAKLADFHQKEETLSEKAYLMLQAWKCKEGSHATYQVLYEALCHDFVGRRDLAEEICCNSE